MERRACASITSSFLSTLGGSSSFLLEVDLRLSLLDACRALSWANGREALELLAVGAVPCL